MDPVTGSIVSSILGSAVTGWFNKSSAKDSMKAQLWASSTAHQREVQDLYKAGLNPILSAKYGGSSGISGAQATMPDLGPAMGSALALKKAQADTSLVKETANTQKEETKNKLVMRELMRMQSAAQEWQANYYAAQDKYWQEEARIKKMDADFWANNKELRHYTLMSPGVSAAKSIFDIFKIMGKKPGIGWPKK